MDGAHDTRLDRSQVVQSFCHRSQAVGGTGSCRNNSILFGQSFVVYVVYDSRQIISSRSGNNYFLSACSDVCRSFLFRGVESGTLQNYIYADLSPRKLSCVSFCINLNLFSVNDDRIISCRYSVSQSIFTLRRIIFQQMCKHFRRSKVVDCYYLISLCAKHLSECQTANTSESIDRYFYCHVSIPPKS